MDVLGPVTYIVEIEEGQRWKRHIDQLKDRLTPTSSDNSRSQPETHHEQSEQFFPDSSDPYSSSDTTECAADPINSGTEELETPETEVIIPHLLLRSLQRAVPRLLSVDILPATDNHQTTTTN